MKIFVLVMLLFGINLYAQKQLNPNLSLMASGDVQDMVISGNLLYVATNASKIDIFDIVTKELVDSIKIPMIKDFIGKDIDTKIYSVDVLDDKVLFVSEGEMGYRNLWIYTNNTLQNVIDVKSKYFIRKARFVDNSKVLIGLLTNEHILYDTKTKKLIYNNQLSTSSFSDFTLSEDKLKFVSSDESGIARVVDTYSGKVLKEYDGQNVDKVFQLDFKKGVILTAGQDRRAVIYKPFGGYYLQFDFLLYSCALSEDAKLAAVAYNIENDVLIYEVDTKNRLYELKNARATITKILFINDNEILVSSDSKQINYYKLN